jgi:hypothetical protein
MECFFDPRRTRTAIKCVSFGAILLWILWGSYIRQEPAAVVHEGVTGRHLLYTSELQELGGPSQAVCKGLLYEDGQSVDTDNDQVGCGDWFSMYDFLAGDYVPFITGALPSAGVNSMTLCSTLKLP